MYYVLQEGMFREEGHNALVGLLERHGFEYEEILFRPFVEGIDLQTKRRDVFVFGSVNLSKQIVKHRLYPGTLDNENHDAKIYGAYYGKEMLNSDCEIVKFGDVLDEKWQAFFARPTKDTKCFSGQVFTRAKWEHWQKDLSDSNLTQRLNEETEVLIAPLKEIQQEIRCWIVGGKCVTASLYKSGHRLYQENYDWNEEIFAYANKIADIFSPARAFVLDVCLFENDWKVVEVNCINSSGFYKGDMSKLLQALENEFKTI